ncbi:MAG: hypothetical protein ACE363_01160 [Alphaproteobacteria bacterium]
MRLFLSVLLLLAWPVAAQDASQPLKGQSPQQIKALFGEPELLTRDAPVQIWQYGNDVCVAHVFFYPQGDAGALAVEHVETRMRDGYTDRPELCQAALAGQPFEDAAEGATAPETDKEAGEPVSQNGPALNAAP